MEALNEASGRAHTLHPLFPEEMLSLSTELEVGWMPLVVWTLRTRERILPVGGIELRSLHLPAHSLSAIPTTLFRLSYNLLTYLHTYLLTYSMVQSPSWEANWFAASQEIPRISRNPKVHYRTHKRPPPVSILGQLNPVHIPTSHLLEFHPNIIHPSTPRSPQWSPSLRFPQQDPLHPLSSNYKVVSFKNTLGTTLYRLLKKSISQSLFPCHKQHSTSFQQLYILQCTLRVNDPNLNKLRTT